MGVITNRFIFPVLSKSKHILLQNPNPSPNPLSLLSLHCSLSSSSPDQTPQPPNPNPSRTRTPLEKQFDTWIHHLRPGFTASDVDAALRSQSDPDLALDIFRWTALQRNYRHTSSTYLTMLNSLLSGRRFSHAETLIDEVVSGACPPDLPLFNTIIRFCCTRKHLFSRSFDVFKKMQRSGSACRPSIETYSMLLNALLRRFGKTHIAYVYLHAVRSLVRQMKASGVIPDTFAVNLIIKAFSKCLEMDEAIRIFKEMGLYGCEPNEFTYGYIAKGLCEKGRVEQGVGFYREMREKGLLPTSSVYMAVICSLALERRFEESIEVLYDMLGNSRAPDVLTYRTLLEELCREGKADEAFELLEELGRRKGSMDRKTYSNLLDGLHWLCQPHQ